MAGRSRRGLSCLTGGTDVAVSIEKDRCDGLADGTVHTRGEDSPICHAIELFFLLSQLSIFNDIYPKFCKNISKELLILLIR
jgi:hypothetical protein